MILYLALLNSDEDQSKFEKIYATYKGLMFHVANKILNNETEAEDAVHNAFIKIAENIRKINDPVCPKTQNFVVTIVERKAIDQYRVNQKKEESLFLDETTDGDVGDRSMTGLAYCLSKLSLRYREVILLKYYHGYTNSEVAGLLDLTEANVIKIDHRAQHKLKKILKDEEIL